LTDHEVVRRPVSGGRALVLAMVVAVIGCLLVATIGYLVIRPPSAPVGVRRSAPPAPFSPGAVTFARATNRTVARDSTGAVVASFTDGSRTVLLTGRERTFTEPAHTAARVTSRAWVRLAPREWRAGAENDDWVRPWLAAAAADNGPDVLAVATEYLAGAPDRTDDKGVRFAGDASFGPLSETDPDGRAENSDFYDYLGVPWRFPDTGAEKPDPGRYGNVDCSGFLRLVYGYRLGYPLRDANTGGVGLPRRAFAMSQFGPGVEVIPNRGAAPAELTPLQPGDLVFFNSDPGTGPYRTDHSGIFLGMDSDGH
jgi:cell wall-associated NlpC family hydrolase